MKHLQKLSLMAVGAVTFLFASCLPSGPDYVEDYDIVYTTYDEEYDFMAQNTYAMPNQIVTDVKINNGDTSYVYMDDEYANQILAKIDLNMQANGWTKVGVNDNPDMLMMPGATSSTNYYYYWWYDWWWGWYYPSWWGWYYPPYYPVSSYSTGSLILALSDPDAAQSNPLNQSSTSWLFVGNGILTYYNDINRVLDAIDQGFDQSPYLQSN